MIELIISDYRFRADVVLKNGERVGLLDTEEAEYDWGKALMIVYDLADPVSDRVTTAPGIIQIDTRDTDRWLGLIPRIVRGARR